jgi:hypothetical protein
LQKNDADLAMLKTRQGVEQQILQMDKTKNKFLPQQLQLAITNTQSEINKRASDVSNATAKLNETIRQHDLTNLNADRTSAIRAKQALITQQDALRNEAKGLMTTGMDDTPDPNDPNGTPLVQTLGQKIIDIQKQIDAADQTIKDSSDPNLKKTAVLKQLPNSTDVSTDPKLVSQIKTYYTSLSPQDRKDYLARTGKFAGGKPIPDDVRKALAGIQ